MSGTRLDPELDPRLVEAAVLAAVRTRGEARAFHAERDALYAIADPEAREAAFDALHARWFDRLALARPFREALAAQPAVAAHCARWLVAAARRRGDEAADLLVVPSGRPTLVVRVMPETVVSAERLTPWLHAELLHVADMLDPRFAYTATLPPAAGGPRERLVREHYRVLWSTFVAGRLVRRGILPATARAERLAEFARTFAIGAGTVAAFERVFGRDDLTHAELLALATVGRDGAPAPDTPRAVSSRDPAVLP